jgi:AcrR family transcriptional regulator
MTSDTSHRNNSFQLILETTEQLIKEKGCRLTTLQDIMDRSGLSKGAIYHYVSGKDELFGRILKARMEQVNARFMEVVSSTTTKGLNDPLQAIAEGAFRNAGHLDVANKIFIYLLGQMDNPKVADLVKEIYDFSLATAKKWIEYGQNYGVIPNTIDAEKMATIFLTFQYGMRVQNTILQDRGGKLDLQDVFHVMMRSLQ